MAIIQATIFFEKRYWVGVFEGTDRQGYSIARHIFGGEPADAEVYSLVLSLYAELKFAPAKEVIVQIHRMNPKRGAAGGDGKEENAKKKIEDCGKTSAQGRAI